MLNPPLPERVWFYPIDHAAQHRRPFTRIDSDFSTTIALHVFLGCIGVAPTDGEARSSVVPAEFGGNMDAPEVSVGQHAVSARECGGRAALYGRWARGDGRWRSGGTGDRSSSESSSRGAGDQGQSHRVAADSRTITKSWPREFTGRWTMRCGSRLRSWFRGFMTDYGLSELDAYELLSQVGKIHLTEMVDPNYVVVAQH